MVLNWFYTGFEPVFSGKPKWVPKGAEGSFGLFGRLGGFFKRQAKKLIVWKKS